MSDAFIPEDYKQPEDSNYMQLEEGENKFRFLSKPIMGMEYWRTIGGKRTPIRKHMGESIPVGELELDKWGNIGRPKHFWAMIVYNYQAQKVQILEVVQKTIITAFIALIGDSEWGDPREYDISISRKGKEQDTEYQTLPKPIRPLVSSIKIEFENSAINLEALYESQDPFGEVLNERVDPSEIPF